MIKTLVTGGAGFVGSCLVRRLLERGHQVVVLDDMSRGSRANLPSDENLLIIEGDIRDEGSLREAMADRPNHVFHLAALHYIPYCNAHPNKTISVNVHGTQCVLSAVREAGTVEKLIFASTAAVYAPASTPHVESEVPTPIDIYGVSKLFGEALGRAYAEQHDMSVICLRPHYIVQEELSELTGPVGEGRVAVWDVIEAFKLALKSDIRYGVYNITGKDWTRVTAAKAQKELGYTPRW